MDDRVRLKVYYHSQISLQTSEGAKFVCENPLDIIIPFTLSFEELKGVICEKMDSQISSRVSCVLYIYPVPVFGGFVQFQTKYVTDEASMQEIFSVYLESRSRILFIELYVEFEQSAADRDIELEDYNSDIEEEFESNYEVVDSGVDEDQAVEAMVADVADVANALANQQPFVEPSFMRSLDLEAMHAPEFPQYVNAAELPLMPDGKFTVGMKFSSREAVIKAMKEAVIKAMKDYTIRRGVDYRVHESEPTTFYAKCTQYGAGCDWLIRVSKMSRKFCWEIRRYNGSHTCTRATISQDHSMLDFNTVAEAIKPLVEVDPSIRVKSVIAEVQAKFNYTISYRKAWLAKQKAVESIFGGWEASYEALPIWFEAMCHKEPSAVIQFETMPAYQGDDLVPNIRVLHRVFWSYYPCIRAFRHCKLIVQHIVTRDSVGLISDRHDSIRAAIARSNGAWSPPRVFHMFCIRHIESNFLRKFKALYLQKLIVNIGYSRTVREYKTRYQRLRERGEAYTNWLDRIPREQLNELFTRKRAEAEARINAGHVFSELVTSKLHANQRAAGNIQVSCFDRQNEVFEVRECPSGVEYAVDLRRQRCDCGEFQVDRLPCRHVFACCANQRLDLL
ncbi:hypothetical protein Ahy_B01g052866 [Arachis hypogaea]|uniref:SWIM-type domain-containing protein n=1 Tax=Arachis hypogaea TaxID=3818 RepID=A0A445AQJ7_ARAHY|nr:hypothetical protein Ahy_B01g052866 [Arachis hypogaea]